jgi:hypothetical protein
MATALALMVLTTVGLGPTGAQTGGGELGPDYVRASAADLGSGSFPGGGVPARAPSAASPFTWQRWSSTEVCAVLGAPPTPEQAPHVSGIDGPIVVGDVFQGPGTPLVPPWVVAVDDRSAVPPDATIVGDLAFDVGIQGARTLIVPRCVVPATPALPEPPSPTEVWQQTPLPRTRVNASPPGTAGWSGITRLTTRFWGSAVPETTASVSLRGFDVEVAARPIAYAWVFGNGATAIADHPGSIFAPFPVTYVRRGDYRVVLYVVWEGRSRMWFGGLPLPEQDLGTVTLPEARSYHVAEIRAVLRSTPGRGR